MFLKKHFISYSCILFIKFNALRSFCIKMLYFFKNLIFPEFRPIELVFRLIKIAIKICYESLSVSIGARLVLDQSKHFRPIESNFRSVENRIESFLKTEFLMCSYTFSNSFSLYLVGQRLQARFFSFSSQLFARFYFYKAGKTLLPLLFHLFYVFMH